MEGVHDYHKTSIDIIVSQENITNADLHRASKTTHQTNIFVCTDAKNAASFLHSDFDF